MKSILCAILATLAISSQASAFVFAPAFTYSSSKEDSAKSSSFILDLRFGTMFWESFYAGGLYDIQREDSGGADTNTWALAPSAGLILDNFSFIVSYHVLSERQTPTVKYGNGIGPQIDIAYALPLGGTVKMGPQFTWREILYSEPTSKRVSSIHPYLAFFFTF